MTPLAQARHTLRKPPPHRLSSSKGDRRLEPWRAPPTVPLYTGPTLCSYKLKPIGQPSAAPAWEASWGWDAGLPSGPSNASELDATRFRLLNTQLHAQFALRLRAAEASASSDYRDDPAREALATPLRPSKALTLTPLSNARASAPPVTIPDDFRDVPIDLRHLFRSSPRARTSPAPPKQLALLM